MQENINEDGLTEQKQTWKMDSIYNIPANKKF